jgi:N-acetylglutamate synthase-like GNAT family acetyltransferase
MFRNGLLIEPLSSADFGAFLTASRQTFEETYPIVPKETLDKMFRTDLQEPCQPAEYGNRDCHYLVAKHEGKIIGYAQLKLQNDGCASLEKLFVLRQYQRQGCGNWLLQACYRRALLQECHSMILKVFCHHASVRAFFEKQGFAQRGEPTQEEKVSGNFDYTMQCDNIRLKLRAEPVAANESSWWGRFDFKVGGLLSLASWFLSSRVTPSVPLQGLAILFSLGAYAYKVAYVDGAPRPPANNSGVPNPAGNDADLNERLLSSRRP